MIAEPTIKTTEEKKLIGKRLVMSLAQNRTGELWKSFMPRRREIQNTISNDMYSVQVNEGDYYKNFDPEKTFQKWAAVEVSSFENIPAGMEPFILPKGLYAVFYYKGLSTDTSIFQYIFTSWLPNSSYLLDSRPQFEVLGEKYRNNDTESEEELWIPVRPKE